VLGKVLQIRQGSHPTKPRETSKWIFYLDVDRGIIAALEVFGEILTPTT